MVKSLPIVLFIGLFFHGMAFGETKTYEFSEIESLRAAGHADVFVTIGDKQSVAITAAEDVFPHLNLTMEDKSLVIDKDEGWFFNKCPGECRIKIELTVKSLKKVHLAGSTNFVAKDLSGEEFAIHLAGSSQARLEGKVKSLRIKTAGSSEVQASKLIADRVIVNSAGSSDIQVHAEKELEAQVAGSGAISYTGNPTVVKQKVAGSGSVNKRG